MTFGLQPAYHCSRIGRGGGRQQQVMLASGESKRNILTVIRHYKVYEGVCTTSVNACRRRVCKQQQECLKLAAEESEYLLLS